MPSPMSAAMPYFDKASDLFKPYLEQGQSAYGQLSPIYGQMAQDPAAYLDQLMKNYAPSQAYQNKFGEMSQAAANTAAAGGMRGSLQDIQNQAKIAQSLMGEDMQQWLGNVMNLQGAGLQGLGHFYDTGYGATGDLSNIYGTQGTLAYQNQLQENEKKAARKNALLKALGAIGGGFAGFTASGGNPFGAMAGAGLGSSFF